MNNYEITEKFAQMWRKSRTDAGKSQEFLAKALGVSKTTIQNWESGLSSPSQIMGFKWFKVLGLQPLSYYMTVLYPNMENETTSEEVDRLLMSYLKDIPLKQKQKLLYVIAGNHGSSPTAILDMVTAHLHTPLEARVTVCGSVKTNYQLAEATNTLIEPGVADPDLDVIAIAMHESVEAIKSGTKHYTILRGDMT